MQPCPGKRVQCKVLKNQLWQSRPTKNVMKPWYCRHITLYISIPCCYKVPVRRKQHCMLVGGFRDFVIFTPTPGEMIQFDEHRFQVGWFNHQHPHGPWDRGNFDTFGVPLSLDHKENMSSIHQSCTAPLKIEAFHPGFVTRSFFLRYILNGRGIFWRACTLKLRGGFQLTASFGKFLQHFPGFF